MDKFDKEKILCLIVGTGNANTSDSYLDIVSKAINDSDAENICLFYSKKSSELTEKIKNIYAERNIISNVFDKNNMEFDADKCFEYFEKYFSDILNKFKRENITIDFTHGTKAMSVALYAVGMQYCISDFQYVVRKTDENNKFLPNCEQIKHFDASYARWLSVLKSCKMLFKSWQFSAVKMLLAKEICPKKLKQTIDNIKILIDFCISWDSFDYKGALHNLPEFSYLKFNFCVNDNVKNLLSFCALQMKEPNDANGDILSIEDLQYNKKIAISLMFDIYANAYRRLESGQIEDESLNKNDFLFTFTPKELSTSLNLTDKNRLLELSKKSELSAIHKFFKSKAADIAKNATKRAIVSQSIAYDYEKKVGEIGSRNNNFNKFVIEENIYNKIDCYAYIPGSSIKGAIRTALMSEKNVKECSVVSNNEKNVENSIYHYNDATNDPFKMLKISDMVANESFLTNIVIAENVKRKINKITNANLSVRMEVIPQDTIFTASLDTNENFESIENIRHLCNEFYGKILKSEQKNLEEVYEVNHKFFANLWQKSSQPNAFLLRIGKHSGAESVTIEGLRKIKIMQKKTGEKTQSVNMDHSTTYWISNKDDEMMPFGWCLVEYEILK